MPREAPSHTQNSTADAADQRAKCDQSVITATLPSAAASTMTTQVKTTSPIKSAKKNVVEPFVKTLHVALQPYSKALMYNVIHNYSAYHWKYKKNIGMKKEKQKRPMSPVCARLG